MPSRLALQYPTLGYQPGNSRSIDVEQFRHLYLSLAMWTNSHAAIDEWATQMQLKPMLRGRVQLYSTGLSEMEHRLTGVQFLRPLIETLVRAGVPLRNITLLIATGLHRPNLGAESGERAIAVVPEGPYVIPFRPPS
jgi:hypothetical protein